MELSPPERICGVGYGKWGRRHACLHVHSVLYLVKTNIGQVDDHVHWDGSRGSLVPMQAQECCVAVTVIGSPKDFQGCGPEPADIEPVGTRMGKRAYRARTTVSRHSRSRLFARRDSVNGTDKSVPGREALFIWSLAGTS